VLGKELLQLAAKANGQVQKVAVVVVAHSDIGAVSDEGLNRLPAAFGRGQQQRRAVSRVLAVDVHALKKSSTCK
jgi:ABC-type microcin C transport system duplicated ATPase subunit YejF